ncbi:phage tail assembly protein [Pseudomonas nitroreducens]|uniref:phage tail assembly protein n=1 Tax=Pseudomonas nitroreducens TaxID=46680 RepID=UPI00030AA10B|nr:phage tail assembly protein [Pseudomonas nitroreducens]
MSELKTLPAWLSVTDDGATVKLSRPAEFNGVQQDTLTLRSPTVRDIRAATRNSGDDDDRELQLFASLAQVGRSELEALKLTDYQRLQAAYFRLVQDDGVPPRNP